MTDKRDDEEDRNRVNAENVRESTERWRVKDAAAQAGAEGNRQFAEGARVDAEQRRSDAEALGVIAEHVRELRSEMRASTEQANEMASALRSAAEDMRLAAEGVRAASEDARVATAEQRQLLKEMQAAAEFAVRFPGSHSRRPLQRAECCADHDSIACHARQSCSSTPRCFAGAATDEEGPGSRCSFVRAFPSPRCVRALRPQTISPPPST